MFRSAKLWLLFALVIIIVNSNLLILAAGLSEGEHLGKAIAGDGDYPTYLAKMKIGLDGGWRYINRYTTEPHDPSYLFLFYILLGHLAGIFKLNLHITYHAARFILAFFALKVLYDFIKKYWDEREPATVLLLAVFLSGSYLFNIDGVPQCHIYSGMMGYTHYMLTLICLLKFFESVLDYDQDRRGRHIGKAIVTLNILAAVHPFMVVLAGLVITGTVIMTGKLARTFSILAAAALSSTPLMFYYFYVFTYNPVLAGWREQAATSHFFLTHLFLYGLGSLFAYFTIISWARGKVVLGDASKLFAVWLFTALSLSYTGLITSRIQWFFFASLPVACLAYKFIKHLDTRAGFKVRLKGRSVVAWLLLLILVLPSFSVIFLMDCRAFRIIGHKEEFTANIIPPEDMKCFEWLKTNAGKNDIIMADIDTGNLIPFVTGSCTFIGHTHETMDYSNKKAQVDKFMKEGYTEGEARDFLKKNRIRYVIKKNLGRTGYAFLKPVMAGKSFTVYVFDGLKQ